jgi:hypothetical protein
MFQIVYNFTGIMLLSKSLALFSIFVIIFSLSESLRTTNATNLEQQQLIVEHPTDQQAKIGEQVLLKCKIRNLKGEPQWCIDDFCLGISKKEINENHQVLKGRPRHRIVGDKSKGEFHLLIEPVQLQDNMYYYCMVTAASESVKAVKSKKAFLTVLSNLTASYFYFNFK